MKLIYAARLPTIETKLKEIETKLKENKTSSKQNYQKTRAKEKESWGLGKKEKGNKEGGNGLLPTPPNRKGRRLKVRLIWRLDLGERERRTRALERS